jgi:hypothetical protein
MMKALPVVLVLLVLWAAGAAMALEAPQVQSPQEGAALGPNYDVAGSLAHKGLVVVITDVINTDTNVVLGSVPGIRHWTEADGRFLVRVASPRVAVGVKDTPLAYRIRIFEATKDEVGPETVINATKAQ